MKTWEYYIQGTVWEPSGLDDGSGWWETLCDWTTVQAPTWREARRLGRVKIPQVYGHLSMITQNRRDGMYPFTGEHCRRLRVSDEDA